MAQADERTTPRRPAVFFDRDGVLNHAPTVDGVARSPRSVGELRIVEGARDLLGRLRDLDYELVIVTNQPDVARGLTTAKDVLAINELLSASLLIPWVYCCFHDESDRCTCRKPRSGLLRQAASERDLDLSASWLIGDRWIDIAAGSEAGVQTILLHRPYSWSPSSSGSPPRGLRSDHVASDLAGCVELIIAAGHR
jgi:D-glycero-D-manno-heptose 1,7-bisphosphate phosphatase